MRWLVLVMLLGCGWSSVYADEIVWIANAPQGRGGMTEAQAEEARRRVDDRFSGRNPVPTNYDWLRSLCAPTVVTRTYSTRNPATGITERWSKESLEWR